jgi:mitochondrial pyruvate carrier 2
MQWALVLTGVSDFARPAENLSLTQNLALTATGAIWTRWCLIIKPKNYFLAAVNFFLFLVGTTQVSRIFVYQQSLKGASIKDEAKAAVKEEVMIAENIVKDPEAAAKQAIPAK